MNKEKSGGEERGASSKKTETIEACCGAERVGRLPSIGGLRQSE